MYISLLRGINVSGKNMIKMATLVSLYKALGFTNVQTYLQSGNVVFDAKTADPAVLAARIKKRIAADLKIDVPVLVRGADEWRHAAAANPFGKRKGVDPATLHVTFLAETPAAPVDLQPLQRVKTASEEFALHGREVYLSCPDGYGRTKLSNQLIEKTLGASATTRNWKTVNALLELSGA